METTKLIVEYLIIGLLICLSIIFLIFNIFPNDIQSVWLTITQYPSLVGAGVIGMLLPIAYGVGMVVEYLGMIPYEGRFNVVKEKRFPIYIEQNLDWLTKTPLFKKFPKDHLAIPIGTGRKLYGEMRFFVLMNNAYLYAEIERHHNQIRILRVLTFVETFIIVGLIVQFVTKGISSPALATLVAFILLLISNIGAILYRFNHYCRAIERSYKVLSLDELNKTSRK